MLLRRITPLAAVAALAIAGCGGDDNGGDSSSSSTADTSAATTSGSGGGAVQIHMKNIAFDPKSVTVKVGQKVEWVNDDTVDHDVVATKGEDFKSKTFGKDGTYSYTVEKAGTIEYVCSLHPGMDGTLTVTQ